MMRPPKAWPMLWCPRHTPRIGIFPAKCWIAALNPQHIVVSPGPCTPNAAGISASAIHHNNTSVFHGLPNPFTATRYHSLVIERETLPECLEITAWTDDNEIMGVRHKTLAVHGVQFHPESILTEHGHDMLANFLRGNV